MVKTDWERQEAGARVHHGLPEGAVKGTMVNKEPEIPHRLNRLFNDVEELRETVLYLGTRLDPLMSHSEHMKERPEKVSQDPSTAISARIAEINYLVDDTRRILSDMLDRLEV